eukprot:Opistho-2@69884
MSMPVPILRSSTKCTLATDLTPQPMESLCASLPTLLTPTPGRPWRPPCFWTQAAPTFQRTWPLLTARFSSHWITQRSPATTISPPAAPTRNAFPATSVKFQPTNNRASHRMLLLRRSHSSRTKCRAFAATGLRGRPVCTLESRRRLPTAPRVAASDTLSRCPLHLCRSRMRRLVQSSHLASRAPARGVSRSRARRATPRARPRPPQVDTALRPTQTPCRRRAPTTPDLLFPVCVARAPLCVFLTLARTPRALAPSRRIRPTRSAGRPPCNRGGQRLKSTRNRLRDSVHRVCPVAPVAGTHCAVKHGMEIGPTVSAPDALCAFIGCFSRVMNYSPLPIMDSKKKKKKKKKKSTLR